RRDQLPLHDPQHARAGNELDAATAVRLDDRGLRRPHPARADGARRGGVAVAARPDRKSTRLNSSHGSISYAVFCLKKNTISLLQGKSPDMYAALRASRAYVHAVAGGGDARAGRGRGAPRAILFAAQDATRARLDAM